MKPGTILLAIGNALSPTPRAGPDALFLSEVKREVETSREFGAEPAELFTAYHSAHDAFVDALASFSRDEAPWSAVFEASCTVAALATRIATEGVPGFATPPAAGQPPATSAGSFRYDCPYGTPSIGTLVPAGRA